MEKKIKKNSTDNHQAPTAPTAGKRLTAREKARARLADPLLPRKLHREDNVVADGFINSKRDKRLIKHSAFVSRVAQSAAAAAGVRKRGGGDDRAKKGARRRRPSKKLVATLESLEDALDDIRAEMDEQDEQRQQQQQELEGSANQGKVRHKSLRTRPGALKRKEKLVRGEMERFGRSLAQLASIANVTKATSSAPSSSSTTGNASGTGTGSGSGTGTAEEVNASGDQQMDTDMTAGDEKPEGQAQTQTQTQMQTQTPAQPLSTSSRWAALRGFISATMEQNPAFLKKT